MPTDRERVDCDEGGILVHCEESEILLRDYDEI
jgi:hypothetical protein